MVLSNPLLFQLTTWREYSNHLIETACSNSPFFYKTFLFRKNVYLPTLPDDNAKILEVCLSRLC